MAITALLKRFQAVCPIETELPAPVSELASAERELEDAARACEKSSARCASLDHVHAEWQADRNEAFMVHSRNLDKHSAAKDRWLRLSKEN